MWMGGAKQIVVFDGFWTLKQTLKRHFFRRSLQRKQKWRLEPTSLFRIAISLTRRCRLSLEIISEETPKLLLAFLRIVLCLSDRTLKKWRRQKPVRGAHLAPVLVLATVASLWCAWKMGPGDMSFNGVLPPGLDLVVCGREESLHSHDSPGCANILFTNGLWEGTQRQWPRGQGVVFCGHGHTKKRGFVVTLRNQWLEMLITYITL